MKLSLDEWNRLLSDYYDVLWETTHTDILCGYRIGLGDNTPVKYTIGRCHYERYYNDDDIFESLKLLHPNGPCYDLIKAAEKQKMIKIASEL